MDGRLQERQPYSINSLNLTNVGGVNIQEEHLKQRLTITQRQLLANAKTDGARNECKLKAAWKAIIAQDTQEYVTEAGEIKQSKEIKNSSAFWVRTECGTHDNRKPSVYAPTPRLFELLNGTIKSLDDVAVKEKEEEQRVLESLSCETEGVAVASESFAASESPKEQETQREAKEKAPKRQKAFSTRKKQHHQHLKNSTSYCECCHRSYEKSYYSVRHVGSIHQEWKQEQDLGNNDKWVVVCSDCNSNWHVVAVMAGVEQLRSYETMEEIESAYDTKFSSGINDERLSWLFDKMGVEPIGVCDESY